MVNSSENFFLRCQNCDLHICMIRDLNAGEAKFWLRSFPNRSFAENIFYKLIVVWIQECSNPNWPGRFCKLPKNWKFFLKNCISTTTPTRETNYSAFERSGIGLSFYSGESLSPRPPSPEFWFLFPVPPPRGSSALRVGLVVTTGYYWGLLHKDLS